MTAREKLIQALNDPDNIYPPGTDLLLSDYLEMLGCWSDCITCYDPLDRVWYFTFIDNDSNRDKAIAATMELVEDVQQATRICKDHLHEGL